MVDSVSNYGSAIAITTSDSQAVQMGVHGLSDALYFVGAASGTLAVIMGDGSTQSFTGLTVVAGQLLPLRVRNVLKTGTNVTGVIALFR